MNSPSDIERRQFLRVAGAGALAVLLGVHLYPCSAASTREPRPFDAWIKIMGDGRVVLLVAKAEMGQGVLTSLSRILAEELDVDWANVDVRQAPVNPAQYDHLTVGSDSVRSL